jgi:hypothetical protein
VSRAAFLGAVALAGVIGCGPAAADLQSCADFGGTVDSAQICRSHTATASYAINLSFPVDYPDAESLMAYVAQRRDQLVDYAEKFPLGDRPGPYQLAVSAEDYRSTGTRSVVLRVGEDAGVHPVSTMKAFNYDLAKQAPITYDTYFKPGAFDVIAPAVRRDLASSTQMLPPRGGLDPANYRNFAITDQDVIFFFDQDQMFGQNEGPLHAAVPRAELAPYLY